MAFQNMPNKTSMFEGVTRGQWLTLTGSWMSWLFDALDAGIFAFVISYLVKDFNAKLPDVVSIVSYFLIATAIGGVFMGNLADRIGRKKTILFSVFAYGVFTVLAGTAQNLFQMGIYRFLVGLAVGGLWGAAAALISEIWAPEHRGKATAILQTGWAGGNLLAAIFAMNFLPIIGWRGLFYICAIPAVIAFFFVLFFVQESPIWLKNRGLKDAQTQTKVEFFEIFKGKNLKITMLGLIVSICGMFGYWILFTFLPTYLATTLHQNIGQSAVFLVWTGIGGVIGYIIFGILADKYGRRKIFSLFFLGMAIMVPIFTYTVTSSGTSYLAFVSVLLGFFTGYFSGYGAWYSELFPTSIRSTAAGFCFNGGRAAIFMGPPIVANYLIPRFGFSLGIGSASIAYAIAAVLVFTLQETKGKTLTAED